MFRAIGLIVIVISIPLFSALMRGTLAQRRIGWFAIGLLPFLVTAVKLDVAIIPWAMWPGYVKGMTISLLETLAFAIVFTQSRGTGRTPLLWPYLGFLGGSAVATVFAVSQEAALFFSWQLAGSILLFLAVAKVTARAEGVRAIVSGFAVANCIEAYFSLLQRAHGVTQAHGTMVHQNLLGLSTHFTLLLSLAAILSGDRRWLPKAGVVSGIIVMVLSGSRASLIFAGIGVVTLVLLSIVRRPTAIKMRFAAGIFVVLLIAAPVGYATLHSRFNSGPVFTTDDERIAFERAARAMWTDHPMGVGANQYVVRANVDGYSQRAGVGWMSGSRGTNVHNVYLLIGAEMGYVGLASFLFLIAAGVWRAFRLAWMRPRTMEGEMALGAGVTILIVALHSQYEWVFITWTPQSLFAITLGIVAGLTNRREAERRTRRRLAAHSVPQPPLSAEWPEAVPA